MSIVISVQDGNWHEASDIAARPMYLRLSVALLDSHIHWCQKSEYTHI